MLLIADHTTSPSLTRQPGHWLTYSFTLHLVPHQHSELVNLLVALRASATDPSTIPQRLPPTMPLPPDPKSLLSSIRTYRFEMRYLLEALVSHNVITTEDLTITCAALRGGDAPPRPAGTGMLDKNGRIRWTNDDEGDDGKETDEKKKAILLAMFGLGSISGRLPQVFAGECCSQLFFVDPRVKEFAAHFLGQDTDLRAKIPNNIRARTVPQHSCLIRRVLVTPTRLILYPPEPDTSNPVLQHYSSHHDRFLRVQFADECAPLHFSEQWRDQRDRDGSWTGSVKGKGKGRKGKWCPGRGMVGRMGRVMEDGLDFAGRRWGFLAAGGSGLQYVQSPLVLFHFAMVVLNHRIAVDGYCQGTSSLVRV